MGVKVREKVQGSGVFWVFIHHHGKRVSLCANNGETLLPH